MKQKYRFSYLLALIGTTFASPAFAGVSTITSPYVEEGVVEAEVKAGYSINEDGGNDDHFASEATLGYGVTSWWKIEAGGEFQHTHDDGNEFSALVLENTFQLAPAGQLFVDPGLKFEVEKSLTGGPDEVSGKLLLAKTIGKFSNISNVSIGRDFGEDSEGDTEYGFSYGLIYDQSEDFQFGAEWHSDFGNFDNDFDEQGHRVGPVLYGELPGGLAYETGVLFGVLESAPDAEIKAVLEYEF